MRSATFGNPAGSVQTIRMQTLRAGPLPLVRPIHHAVTRIAAAHPVHPTMEVPVKLRNRQSARHGAKARVKRAAVTTTMEMTSVSGTKAKQRAVLLETRGTCRSARAPLTTTSNCSTRRPTGRAGLVTRIGLVTKTRARTLLVQKAPHGRGLWPCLARAAQPQVISVHHRALLVLHLALDERAGVLGFA